jgi:hypothetical protein
MKKTKNKKRRQQPPATAAVAVQRVVSWLDEWGLSLKCAILAALIAIPLTWLSLTVIIGTVVVIYDWLWLHVFP